MDPQTLSDLAEGQQARIEEIFDSEAAPLLASMGLVPGTVISRVGRAPLGDPLVFVARGARLAIRRNHAESVRIRSIER